MWKEGRSRAQRCKRLRDKRQSRACQRRRHIGVLMLRVKQLGLSLLLLLLSQHEALQGVEGHAGRAARPCR